MKKIILLATTLCLLLVVLVGCDAENSPSGDGLSFPATILEIHDTHVLVQTIEDMGFPHVWELFADIKDNLQNSYDESYEVNNAFDYNAFLELLKANGLVFETRDGHTLNDVHRRAIYIGGERLVVYCGTFLLDVLIPPTTSITWENKHRWPTRDSVSVIYSGDDDRIIEFLNEIFGE